MKVYRTIFVCLIILQSGFVFGQNYITIEGMVYDEYNYPIPYASVGIVKKNIGTSSTEDGGFKFVVTNNELSDTIEISSIGFQSLEITVQDFIALTDKTFVLKGLIPLTQTAYLKQITLKNEFPYFWT